MAIQSTNPATGEVLKKFPDFTPEQVEDAIASAAAAFKRFPQVTLKQRAEMMLKLAASVEAQVDELSKIVTMEMGKPISDSKKEVLKCATCCKYYAENAAEMLATETIPPTDEEKAAGKSMSIHWQPLGVILCCEPFNFPFWQVFRVLCPNLMGGNCILLKHASIVPQCALAIERLVLDAGFPPGVFKALLVPSKAVEKILSDSRVAGVAMTGSEDAGKAVAASAGRLIKPSVLELGGSDPFIVLASADVDKAAAAAVKARICGCNGQSCIAGKRFIVHTDLYDRFMTAFVKGMKELKIGDPLHVETELGPLCSEEALNVLKKQVEDAVKQGARIVLGGHDSLTVDDDSLSHGGSVFEMKGDEKKGYYYRPTVLVDVPRPSEVYYEEIFGPVAMVFRASNVDEAIEIANDTPFGLSASAWTNDEAEREALERELTCGAISFGAMSASDPRLPFGAVKRSGYGRELGVLGMRSFMNCKAIIRQK